MQSELLALQRSFFDRVSAERPDIRLGSSVGCRESDDVRVEVDVYSATGDEGEAVVVRRRCGRRPAAYVALAPKWRPRLRSFRVGSGQRRRTAVVVRLRSTVRVEATTIDGLKILGRIAACR